MRARCSLLIIGTHAFYGMQDELCQLCVMDAKPDEPAKREATTSSSITSIARDRGEEGDVEESGASDNEQHDMPPTPDTVPITTTTAMQETCDEIDAASTVQIESTEKANLQNVGQRMRLLHSIRELHVFFLFSLSRSNGKMDFLETDYLHSGFLRLASSAER